MHKNQTKNKTRNATNMKTHIHVYKTSRLLYLLFVLGFYKKDCASLQELGWFAENKENRTLPTGKTATAPFYFAGGTT